MLKRYINPFQFCLVLFGCYMFALPQPFPQGLPFAAVKPCEKAMRIVFGTAMDGGGRVERRVQAPTVRRPLDPIGGHWQLLVGGLFKKHMGGLEQ